MFNILEESSSILLTMIKKKDLEQMNESNDLDRAFNPFQKKLNGQANISLGTLSTMDQVIYLKRC